jgi:hypothetical protein
LEVTTQLLGYIGIGSSCLPIFILIIIFFQKKNIEGFTRFKILALEYLLLNLFTVVILLFNLIAIQKYVFGFHYLFELTIFTSYFFKFSFSKWKILVLSILIFLLIFFCSLLYYQGVIDFDKYFSVCTNLCLVTFSINYIISVYSNIEILNIYEDGIFLIITGVMFYNAIQFYFSFFESFIRNESGSIFYYLWPIFQISGIIYYSIFTLGLWRLRK